MTSWKVCTNIEYECLRNSRPYWDLYDLKTHQKKLGPDCHRLKTMVKRSIEQNLRIKNFGARNGIYERNAMVNNPGTKQRGQRTLGECWQWKANGSGPKETTAVSVTMLKSVQKWHSRIRLRALLRGKMREMRREPEVPEERVPVAESLDGPAKNTSKELAITHFVKNGTLQNACSTSPRVVAKIEKSAFMRIGRLKNSPTKGPKRMVCWSRVSNTIEQWDLLRMFTQQIHDNWFAYSRMWSRRSLHRFYGRAQTYGNRSDVIKSRQPLCVTLTFVTKILRSDWFVQGEPHQRSPNAPKFEDRSQEETVWQEQGAAWRLASSVLKWKEKNQAAFFSPSENWCLPASNS